MMRIGSHAKIYQKSILGRRNKCKLLEIKTSKLYLREKSDSLGLFRVRRKMVEGWRSGL